MKPLRMLRLIIPVLLISHCASSAKSQQQTNTIKEKYHIKMVLEENGKRKMIDTTFNSLDDLKKFKEQLTPQTSVEHNADRQWHHKVITEDIFIEDGDTSIDKKIYTKKLTADDFKHMHDLLHDEAFENADIVTLMGIDSLKDGHEFRVEAFLTFIDIETPTQDELKKTPNAEIQKAATDKALELKELQVYPNPTNGKLNLTFDAAAGNTNVLITDIQGKVVYTEKIISKSAETVQRSVDLGGQAGGIYFLKISNEGKSLIKKIILSEAGR